MVMNIILPYLFMFPFTGMCRLHQAAKQQPVVLDSGDEMLTGILCREPGKPGEKDAEVVLTEGNKRELAFSKLVVQDGVELGRESAGIQTVVQCKGRAPPKTCIPEPANPPRCSSPDLAQCTCEVDQQKLPHLAYQRKMLAVALPLCENSTQKEFRVLMIGLGGGAMPTYLHHHCARAVIDSIEPDARMIDIAQRFLGFAKGPRDVVEQNYGLQALQKRETTHGAEYDLVLVDCFDGGHIPEACRSQKFVAAVHGVLKTGSGIMLQNGLFPAANDLMKFYAGSFGTGSVNSNAIVAQSSWNGTNHSQRIIEAKA